METKEEKQVIDRNKRGQDLQELNREWYADAPAGRLRPEHVDAFHLVTRQMIEILEGKSPVLQFDERLDPTTRYALQALFEARMSRHADTEEFISGLVRDKQLNQALVYLQPILALALRSDFHEGRAMYDRLVADLNALRSDITSSILVEMPVRQVREEDKAEEQDDDDDGGGEPDPGNDAGDASTADDAGNTDADDAGDPGDGTGQGNADKSQASWIGRLLKRDKNKKSET